ncbi:MAG: hypothetical protein ACYDCM_07270 [Candidatus Acidiferrales bacterium]
MDLAEQLKEAQVLDADLFERVKRRGWNAVETLNAFIFEKSLDEAAKGRPFNSDELMRLAPQEAL